MRWLRWTIALWLGAVAALPWLQWSFSLWRGASLRAELMRLRWWSLAMWRGAMRQTQLRQLHRPIVAWNAATRRARQAIVQQPSAGSAARSPSSDSSPTCSGSQVRTSRAAAQRSAEQHAADRRAERRYERISEAAWHGRLQQLSVFVAWSGWAQRSSTLHRAVSRPSLCKIEFVLCAFSAWVLLARRRGSACGIDDSRLSGNESGVVSRSTSRSHDAPPETFTRGGSARRQEHYYDV